MPDLILASTSPRRQDLLRQLGLDFRVIPPSTVEVTQSDEEPPALVERLAREKAASVLTGPGEFLVIGADTVVTMEDVVLGKPCSSAEAVAMLHFLSGRVHQVVSGVAVRRVPGDNVVMDHCLTQVTMRSLSQREIERYVATGEPLDKAGAYGIQGLGALLVQGINGCYNNVVGLPLGLLAKLLSLQGMHIL